jgi:hypothetical protein
MLALVRASEDNTPMHIPSMICPSAVCVNQPPCTKSFEIPDDTSAYHDDVPLLLGGCFDVNIRFAQVLLLL